MVHMRCVLDYQGYMHVCTRIRPRTRISTSTHSRAHTHRPICNSYCFFTATMISDRASVLRYTYIACIVKHVFRRRSSVTGCVTLFCCASVADVGSTDPREQLRCVSANFVALRHETTQFRIDFWRKCFSSHFVFFSTYLSHLTT